MHSLRQRKKKASFNVVLSFLFESSKSFSGISVMQNPYKKKLKWICCYLNDILPNKHNIILTLFAKSDEITAYKWVCCHFKDIVNIVFCFHFFLENISMRQKNWAAGLSEDFSFTTRVRLGLSIVKNMILIRHRIQLDADPKVTSDSSLWLTCDFIPEPASGFPALLSVLVTV